MSAREAAAHLGHPERAKTFTRRAKTAYDEGDERVQHVAGSWCAPLRFWAEINLRMAGRPRGSRNRSPYGTMRDLTRWATYDPLAD